MATISKKIQELIKTATPKQKAILLCRDWTDRNKVREEPLLTEDEAKAIVNSITPEEAKEYNKWIRCYNVYVEVIPMIGLALAQYREQAEEIVGYLRVLESYGQEENHLNMIYESIKDSKSKTALSEFDKALKCLHFRYSVKNIIRDEEGYIEIDTDSLYKIIKEKIKAIGFAYAALKAFVIALEDWTEKRKAKKLMPPTLSEDLDALKGDYLIDVAPSYSRKFLKDRIAKGHKPTITEQKKALFPCYDDVPRDEEFITLWTNKIESIENSLKNAK